VENFFFVKLTTIEREMMKENTGDPRTFAIIGAAMEVHRHLGCGFPEPIYQDALEIEFRLRGTLFHREDEIKVFYKENELRNKYKPDFICFGEVIVELKALSKLGGTEEMQVLNYLKATGFKAGLLLNFGNPSLEFDRYVWNDSWNPSSRET
jgi:GxxExxY protein